jgi:FkbM family methyltransferase
MKTATKFVYYAKSFFTIVNGFFNPIQVLIFFLQKPNIGEKPFRQVSVKKMGLKFWVRSPMDIWSIKETFLDDFYRLNLSDRLHTGTIIDIGAGIGEFAIQAAAANPDCKVYGFEPFSESFSLFEKNVSLNKLENITAVEAAIVSIPGALAMDTSSGNPLQYRMQTVSSADQKDTIKTICLMDYLEQQSIRKCDLLKLDCEGGEYDILLPLTQEELRKFDRIVMEYHDSLTTHTHQELVNLLNFAGFHVEVTPNKVHADLGYVYAQLN